MRNDQVLDLKLYEFTARILLGTVDRCSVGEITYLCPLERENRKLKENVTRNPDFIADSIDL